MAGQRPWTIARGSGGTKIGGGELGEDNEIVGRAGGAGDGGGELLEAELLVHEGAGLLEDVWSVGNTTLAAALVALAWVPT